MAEHPNVARINDAYAAFAKGDFATLNDIFAEDLLWHEGRGGRSITVNAVDVIHLRDGKWVEVWTVPSDQYAFDEVIG